MIQQELLVPRIIAFLEDYNSLLEGLNDELSAIESFSDWNKEALTLNDVEISNQNVTKTFTKNTNKLLT